MPSKSDRVHVSGLYPENVLLKMPSKSDKVNVSGLYLLYVLVENAK